MILTAHQPVYLPWLGLFHKISLAHAFVSFNQVQYLQKDWNNRNKIKTAQGDIWLTVPVLAAGHREKILTDIEINNSLPWQRKHWKSILLNYKKAPFFEEYVSFFEDVYLKKEWQYLVDLNDYMLRWFLKTLGIDVEFVDARDKDFQGSKNALVLDMCVKMGAEKYIFGILGKDYADRIPFEKKGIKIYFQDYKHPTYPQLHGEFISHLSVIDLLFNCGPDSRRILTENQDQLII
ncbi:MAG: WbqC family protein [Deltaproteobacteria bacterium]|nr:WbqC family protein [Deltaproteobacteria bacterium]